MNITFIGGGNMAQAIIHGLLGKSRQEFSLANLRVVEINPETRQKLKSLGIECFTKAWEAIRDDDVIIFAVKPQNMRDAADELRKNYTGGVWLDKRLVISIAAGIKLGDLSQWLRNTRLIRAMPNTPALTGDGITALYSFPGVSEMDKQCADKILAAVGKTVWVNDEDEMNAVTAISGSGPAYVFLFMEAIEQAAAELKMPKDVARELVLQTFIGASRLAADSREPLAALRERVTSKGGTTEAALNSMAADQVKEAIIRAVKAAYERARELGDELGKH